MTGFMVIAKHFLPDIWTSLPWPWSISGLFRSATTVFSISVPTSITWPVVSILRHFIHFLVSLYSRRGLMFVHQMKWLPWLWWHSHHLRWWLRGLWNKNILILFLNYLSGYGINLEINLKSHTHSSDYNPFIQYWNISQKELYECCFLHSQHLLFI